MNTTDGAILDFLAATPRPIRELLVSHPRGTVYRRLSALVVRGAVTKRGTMYVLTAAGLQLKAELAGAALLHGLNDVYAPIRQAPSPQHRALLELAVAGLVRRRHGDQEEHHAGFLLLGPPLTWKSSAGRFLCLAAGADPVRCVVDLAAETGKSLWIRRGADGGVHSQRSLLAGPVIVLDEYQQADPAVRSAIAPLLSGRYRIPIENDLITLTAVPIVTMNPRAGESLAARTGMSRAQLRRLIPCDLTAVVLPDLALEGERPIEAARQAGALPLRAPRASCEPFRGAVVELLRRVLTPEGLSLVDVDLLLGLGTGLTAWLPTAVAMRQALYDFLLVVETVGWVGPGWLEFVHTFPAQTDQRPAPTGSMALPAPVAGAMPPRQIILLYPQAMSISEREHSAMTPTRESMLPPFSISDRTKGEIIWLAHDAGVSLDRALHVLVEIYRLQTANQLDLGDLETILHLREACETTEVAVEDLREALRLFAALRERGLTLDDLRATCQVAEDLVEAGLSLEEAGAVAHLMKALKKAGTDPRAPDRLEAALKRYAALGYEPKRLGRLAELWDRLNAFGVSLKNLEEMVTQAHRLRAAGLDTPTVEALATALELAVVPPARRSHLLAAIVEKGLIQLELAELRAERDAVHDELDRLRDERAGHAPETSEPSKSEGVPSGP
jgi:hypothetical protein